MRFMLGKTKNSIGYRRLKDLSRADFLTSVGLYITNDRLLMARLRKSFLAVSMLGREEREFTDSDGRQRLSELTGWVGEDVREIALRSENDSREKALKEALVSLLPHINTARDQVYVCLPQEQTVVQQVLLPLAAEDNLQQVLEYEIERQLPFKREQIYYDFLPAGRKGDRLCVYLFAIAKKNLDAVLAALESIGIKPRGVETTVTALANYLLFTRELGASGAALLAVHPGFWEVIGIEAKAKGWHHTAELRFSHRLPTVDWAHGPAREILLECSRQVPRLFRCGDVTGLNGLAAEHLAQAEDIVSPDSVKLKGFTSGAEPRNIPAIGAALRGLREASFRANFLRHESDADQRNAASLLNTVLVSVLALALIAWAASFPIKDELRLRQLQAENGKLAPAIEALRREEEQLERLRKEAAFLSNLNQRRGEVLRVLDELSKTVPSTAYLSNLRYRSGVLELQGNAESASALIPVLERSSLFENVGFNAPSNRGRDNRETFSLKADLEKVKEPSKEPPPTVKDPKGKP
jgi:Tfp pilus assembly protein PilN